MYAKTKTYLEKMTIVLPHQHLKNQQNPNSTQRRKSASAAQRV